MTMFRVATRASRAFQSRMMNPNVVRMQMAMGIFSGPIMTTATAGDQLSEVASAHRGASAATGAAIHIKDMLAYGIKDDG